MKYYNSYIACLMVLLVFWACDEKEGFNYTAGNQIYFENPDSTTYSFAVQASTVLVDTVYIPIHIHGLPADVDRVIDIRIDESLTTAPRGEKEEGAIFNVQPTILPAKTWKRIFGRYGKRVSHV